VAISYINENIKTAMYATLPQVNNSVIT